MSKSKYLFFFLLFFCLNSFGQITKEDSLQINKYVNKGKDSLANSQILLPDSVHQKPFKINPKLATKRSAMIPGWGQAYIKQYWFIPVIYAGFGASTFGILYNGKRYRILRKAYFETSAANLTEGKVTLNGKDFPLSVNNLRQYTNYFRRNRDLSWLSIPVVWAVNILEVNVAAHLKSFDLSDDISMKFEPSFSPNPINGLPLVGGKMVFAFK
jgi:Family of unknown function (DUF5683)